MKKNKESKSKKIKWQLKNPWRAAFLVLVGLLLGTMVFFYTRVTALREPSFEPKKETVANSREATFQVQLKKNQINKIISYYLNDFLEDSGIQYDFYLEDHALLNGTFKVLGHEVQFYLYFDPYVMENGNVQLKATSISIGNLALPISQIMKYVAKDYELPEWVEVSAKEQTIILHLNEFKLENGMYAKAEKINLIDDDIRFNVYLPLDEKPAKGSKKK